jgi:SNF2 family DNA or RNA helicase
MEPIFEFNIKNDVEDLWAIFEFLMPGFLAERK